MRKSYLLLEDSDDGARLRRSFSVRRGGAMREIGSGQEQGVGAKLYF